MRRPAKLTVPGFIFRRVDFHCANACTRLRSRFICNTARAVLGKIYSRLREGSPERNKNAL